MMGRAVLQAAANYLEKWCLGHQTLAKPLDCTHVLFMSAAPQRLMLPSALDQTVDSLVPEPTVVVLRRPPQPANAKPAEAPVSERAKFVYPLAVHFWKRMGMSWPDAVQRSKNLWTQAAGSTAATLRDQDHHEVLGDDDEAGGNVMDGSG